MSFTRRLKHKEKLSKVKFGDIIESSIYFSYLSSRVYLLYLKNTAFCNIVK